jgi:hypothetical protein
MAGIFPSLWPSGNPLLEGPGPLWQAGEPFPQESGSITSSWYPACDVFDDRREDRRRAARSEAEDVKLTLENKTP